MIDLKTKISGVDIDAVIEEYDIDDSMFSEVDYRLFAIADKGKSLSKADKTLIILYAETGSYRDVGSLLGISHTTISRFIGKIRKKLC